MTTHSQHYLFDWGNTLMVDFGQIHPYQTGPMCDWPKVKVVEGALECLQHLSKNSQCHLATNAADSSEPQIRQALQRAGLNQYIQQVFCRENLGVGKTEPEYFAKVIDKLAVPANHVTMIGDSLEKDIYPAMKSGINAIWLNPKFLSTPQRVKAVTSLTEIL